MVTVCVCMCVFVVLVVLSPLCHCTAHTFHRPLSRGYNERLFSGDSSIMAGLSYLVSKDSCRSPLGALLSRASPYPIIYAFIRKVFPYSMIKVLRCLLISLARGRRCNYASVSFHFSVFVLFLCFVSVS